jgi:hypothetical protein
MVQQLDANNDPIEGSNGPVFLSDGAAVAQIILTTLRLYAGEWWENLSLGVPLFQKILGRSASQNAQQDIVLIMQQAILAVPYVLQILSFSLTGNSALRQTFFTATVSTAFGTVVVTNAPGSSAEVSA